MKKASRRILNIILYSFKTVKAIGRDVHPPKPNPYSGKRFRGEKQTFTVKRYLLRGIGYALLLTICIVSLVGFINIVNASGSIKGAIFSSAPIKSADILSVPIQTDNKAATGRMNIEKAPPSLSASPELKSTAVTNDYSGLSPGCHDPRVVDIQTRLMELGYMDSDQATDYYGWGTQYSLELFQRKNSLQIDGLVGEKTTAALFSTDALPYTVKFGDSGNDVKSLQERLSGLGYLKSSVSGYFGAQTKSAVENFQTRNNLTADGDVGEKTREVLFSDKAKAAQTISKKNTAATKPTQKAASSNNLAQKQGSADALIAVAKSLLGSRYILGDKGPRSFDCSGFVYYCLNKAGYKIDYMVSTDWATCSLPKVKSMSNVKAGDIICYSPHHVAIYIGNGQMIDASSSNGKVVQRPCDTSYWQSHFICARRIF